MPFKDECGICGRVLSYRRLKRCQRCGKLYCRDCMVPDVSTGDPTRMLCLHCTRRTVSPRSSTKYGSLSSYLSFRAAFTSIVKLSFAKIDGIIADNLPLSAYRNESWWSNTPSSVHAKAWLVAGWEAEEVNLKEGYVVFKKVREVRAKKRRARGEAKKPFTPVRVRMRRAAVPSKTKASKLYARVKNVERRRSSGVKYRGSFKPRSSHEKRLFKQEEKPR